MKERISQIFASGTSFEYNVSFYFIYIPLVNNVNISLLFYSFFSKRRGQIENTWFGWDFKLKIEMGYQLSWRVHQISLNIVVTPLTVWTLSCFHPST